MGGLQKFVHGNQPASPRHDRQAIGALAKISTSKKPNGPFTGDSQSLTGTTPGNGYASNSGTDRNGYPIPHYQLLNGRVHRDGFDDTVSSGFDATESTVDAYENRPDTQYLGNKSHNRAPAEDQYPKVYNEAMAEDFEAENRRAGSYNENGYGNAFPIQQQPNHVLRHQTSRSPLGNHGVERPSSHGGPAISGRFQKSQRGRKIVPYGDMQLELRPGQDGITTSQPRKDSRKRHRSSENIQQENLNQEQNLASDDDCELPGPQVDGHIHRQKNGGFEGSDVDETLESPIDQHLQGSHRCAYFDLGNASPDYSDEELRKMKYQDLKGQTWEIDPNAKSSTPAPQDGQPTLSLKDRLENCIQDMEPAVQFDYFQHLSMAEWEETGDILIDRFGEILKKIKNARQKRRVIVSGFEKKIEEREDLVRGKSAILEKKFRDMKKSGEGVLRGKLS